MKRGILFLSMLMMASLMGAMEGNQEGTKGTEFYPNLSDYSVDFMERGIHFYVFLDGTFDFTTSQAVEVDYVYKNGRRTPHHAAPRGIRIERDRRGRVIRVGNVFIDYTYNNKVKRIGTVFIKYANQRMKKIGNLAIVYNRFGVNFIGSVKGRQYYNPYVSYQWSNFNDFYFGDTWEYGYYDPFFYGHSFNSDFERFDEDVDFFYYRNRRANGKSEGEVIKRKKAEKSQKNEIRKKVNTSGRSLAESGF